MFHVSLKGKCIQVLWDEVVYKYQLDPVLFSYGLDDFISDGSINCLKMGVEVSTIVVYLCISPCSSITVCLTYLDALFLHAHTL